MLFPKEDAQVIAFSAFEFIGREDDRLSGLLDLAGVDAGQAKAELVAGSDGFFAHILDYVLSHEPWAQAFAEEHNLSPETLDAAARAFGSGRLME